MTGRRAALTAAAVPPPFGWCGKLRGYGQHSCTGYLHRAPLSTAPVAAGPVLGALVGLHARQHLNHTEHAQDEIED